MGHELVPRNRTRLPPHQVVERLKNEFAYVNVDEAEGMKRAFAQAEWLERAPARLFFGHHDKALERAAQLKKLGPGEAFVIEFGDTTTATKSITVLPDEPIRFGYQGASDERASRALVDRCARALDCDVE